MNSINRAAAILPLLMVLSTPALAELGGGEASIAADQAQMKATRRVVGTAQYTVHEIHQDSGTVVREYVSPQGQVFGVAWQGPRLPDLRQILGAYFGDFRAAAASKHARHGGVMLRQAGLVVHSGGHMRAFVGHAYIPQLVPAGVTTDEIQ